MARERWSRTIARTALLGVTVLLLTTCGCAQEEPAAPQPKMEALTIADGESAEGWNVAEATMTPSDTHAREGNALNLHIDVDHTAGEPAYPIGWPRTNLPIPEDQRDWSQWDFLDFWLYADTSRDKLPSTPLGLILRCPDRANSWHRTLSQATKGEWVHFRFPLAGIPNISNCTAIQFFISESNYKHGDVVDFYVDELALLRYAEPAIVSLRPLQGLVYGDAGSLRVEVDISGMKEAERRLIHLHLKRGTEEAATSVTEVTQGRQTLLLTWAGDRLEVGDHTLEADIEGGAVTKTASVRVVPSPWE